MVMPMISKYDTGTGIEYGSERNINIVDLEMSKTGSALTVNDFQSSGGV